MQLPPEPNAVKRRIFLTLLPVVGIVSIGLAVHGLLTDRIATYAGTLGVGAGTIMLLFAVLFRRTDDATFERVERLLIIVAAVITATSVAYGALGRETSHSTFELIRQGIWLPVVYGTAFLVLSPRWGAVVAWGLWFVLAFAASSHLFDPSGHSNAEIGTIVEILLANAIVIFVFMGVSWVVRASERRAIGLELVANTDLLTGLANRRLAERRLEEEVERAARYDRPLSVVLFDLDLFKRVNDTLGHDVGDEVLRDVPTALAGRTRETDTLARWGGEEFVVIAPEMDLARATAMAERFRRLIEEHDFAPDWPMTASFGVAQLVEGDSAADVVRRADEAMYAAKRGGRNAVYQATRVDGHPTAVEAT